MPLPIPLMRWLSRAGRAVVEKRASGGALTADEQLVYEIWLLDTEARNGGLSQYFANRGLPQWQRCKAAAQAASLASFAPFAARVDALIAGAPDPYNRLIDLGERPNEVYYAHEQQLVSELQARSTPQA